MPYFNHVNLWCRIVPTPLAERRDTKQDAHTQNNACTREDGDVDRNGLENDAGDKEDGGADIDTLFTPERSLNQGTIGKAVTAPMLRDLFENSLDPSSSRSPSSFIWETLLNSF